MYTRTHLYRCDILTRLKDGSSAEVRRIIFSVSMEGGARKVVTVRSALAVKNLVKFPLELKLQRYQHEVLME